MGGRVARGVRAYVADFPSGANYLKLLSGRVLTNAGDSLYAVAALWLVFELTGSTAFTGLAAFLFRAPTTVQFLAGPLVDRWPVRRTLVATQAVQAVFVLSIPVAALADALNVWLVLVLIPVLASMNQFVYPAQNAVLPRVVDDDEIVRANSLFTLANGGSNVAFNAVAGGLVAVVGAVAIYVVDAVTFVVAAAVFLSLSLPAVPTEGDGPDDDGRTGDESGGDDHADGRSVLREYVDEVREGIDYVRGSLLATLIAIAAIANLAIGLMWGVLPEYAALRGGAGLYGALLAAIGVGRLAGSAVASGAETVGFGRLVVGGFAFAAVAWLGGVLVAWTPASLALFAIAFVPVGLFNVVVLASVQSAVPDDLIGRVVSVVTSASTTSLAVASLLGGLLGEAVGSRSVMLVTSAGLASVTVYFLARPRLRALPPVKEFAPSTLDLPER